MSSDDDAPPTYTQAQKVLSMKEERVNRVHYADEEEDSSEDNAPPSYAAAVNGELQVEDEEEESDDDISPPTYEAIVSPRKPSLYVKPSELKRVTDGRTVSFVIRKDDKTIRRGDTFVFPSKRWNVDKQSPPSTATVSPLASEKKVIVNVTPLPQEDSDSESDDEEPPEYVKFVKKEIERRKISPAQFFQENRHLLKADSKAETRAMSKPPEYFSLLRNELAEQRKKGDLTQLKQDRLKHKDEVEHLQDRMHNLVKRKKSRNDEDADNYAAKVRDNIKAFFNYNESSLVREKIKPEEKERKKARTWVFFLILIHISACVLYGMALVLLPRDIVLPTVALMLGFYFGFRLLSVGIFCLRRIRNHCCKVPYDPENINLDDYENILVCIPAYNEDRAAFERTIHSIVRSNYPKEKLYMLFIVDGNRARSFESLMETLHDEPYTNEVKQNQRVLEHGVYQSVPYSVFLKEENRGKRDSQWIFVELLRNMLPAYKPAFVFFIDSDTAFDPDSIRYLHDTLKSDPKLAGVCGKLELSNFGSLHSKQVDNFLYALSTMCIVGYQYYEYYFNQKLGKQAEAAYDSVTCLPGAFSMLRSDCITDIEVREADADDTVNNSQNPSTSDINEENFTLLFKMKYVLPLVLDDFFSRPTIGIAQRNLYELGEDRTLSVRFLEKGYKCTYEPRAVAYTECPDTIVQLIAQRRRWNNSTFVNLGAMMFKWKLWFRLRTFPIMIFTFFDLVGAYLLPANAILLMLAIWDPFLQVLADLIGEENPGSTTVVFIWVLMQLVVIASTRLDSSGMFFVLSTFFSGMMMFFSLYFFIRYDLYSIVMDFIEDPAANWALFLIICLFPVLHITLSIPNIYMFCTAGFFFLLLPTSSITIPLYAFLHLDDFSWGTR